jgi:hypothetical protein
MENQNYVGMLNEHCQKVPTLTPLVPDYTQVELSKTPNKWRVTVSLGEYIKSADASTVKEGKQLAAKQLIDFLIDNEIWHDQLAKHPKAPNKTGLANYLANIERGKRW